jgi:G3E family GTPase
MSDGNLDKRLPLYLLTGFLGSGKTTLLQRLLAYCQQQNWRLGLLLNDFGTVNVDSMLISSAGMASPEEKQVQMRSLSGGCACCTVSRELMIDLLEMTITYELDLIIIEASGVADAFDLLDQLTSPGLLRRIYPAAVISVIDGPRFAELANTLPLVRRQAEFADILLLNKCDLLEDALYRQTYELLQELNPHARILPAIYAEVETEELLGLQNSRVVLPDGVEHGHLTFHSLEVALPVELERESFEMFLSKLGREIIRAKGFIKFRGEERSHIFQYVPGQIVFRPLESWETVEHVLVFIGLTLNRERLREELTKCAAW